MFPGNRTDFCGEDSLGLSCNNYQQSDTTTTRTILTPPGQPFDTSRYALQSPIAPIFHSLFLIMLEIPVSSARKCSQASFSTCSWLFTLPFDASDFNDPSRAPTPPSRKRLDLHKLTGSGEKKGEVSGPISSNRMPASPPKPSPQNPYAKPVMPKTPF